MNVLSFPSSVRKSKDGEGTITIFWTLFLKHFRGSEAFLNILRDEFVSSAPLNSNEVLLLLAVCKAHSSCPCWNVSSALLPGFPRQQQAILSAVKMLSIITGLSLVSQAAVRVPLGKPQLAAAAPMPSSWREECTWKRRKTVMKSINNC